MSRAARAAPAIAVVLCAVAGEIGVRAVVPELAVPALRRTHFQRAGADPRAAADQMASCWVWWMSEPDGAAMPRWIGPHGFRGRSWPERLSRGLLVVGDSFVEGLGVGDGETIPSLLGAELAGRGAPRSVLNLGIGGAGFEEYLPLVRDALAGLRGVEAVLVVVYDNDLAQVPLPDPAAALAAVPPAAALASEPPSRLAGAVGRLLAGRRVPVRRPRPRRPEPLAVARQFARDPTLAPRIGGLADEALGAAMLAGRLSPVVVDHLARTSRSLPEPVPVAPLIAALQDLCRARGVDLTVAYLPTLNQVCDAYLPVQRRLVRSPRDLPKSLRAERFQQHARDLAAACARSGAGFVDLTPALARAEALGVRTYYPYDGHTRGAGNRVIAAALAERWAAAG